MKAIVFGGAGFLGSHVADALTEAGHKTTIYDINPSPYIGKDQVMIVGDILDKRKVQESIRGCDVVYNFAAIADIEEASKRPVESVQFNILGNTFILDSCQKEGIERFVFASSIYVYSNKGSIYRSTKQACELIIEDFGQLYGLEYTILRYGSLYGFRPNSGNAIYGFVEQAIKEKKIQRFGNGTELREYIHVFDAAQGSVDILDEKFANQHVTITGPQQTMVRDVLFMIQEIIQENIQIEFMPPKDSYHYEITPYSFAPRIGKRLVLSSYHDLGQGILDMICKLYAENTPIFTSDHLET